MLSVQRSQWQRIADCGCPDQQIGKLDQSVFRLQPFVDRSRLVNTSMINGKNFEVLRERVIIALLHGRLNADFNLKRRYHRYAEAILAGELKQDGFRFIALPKEID